ncbi:MAG: VWA domain-containing protein [Gemmatimonadetes bacterium]|nr:VWA domain-containing protein [Gemmatimonadota bacterium]
MTFSNPAFLAFGVGLAMLVVVSLWSHARRRRRLAEFLGGCRAVDRLSGSNLYRLRVERMILLGVAALALSAAAAEPRWDLPAAAPPPQASRSVVLAIDISASMQATDVRPTRLAQAVRIAGDLIEVLETDRVGLLLFAGSSYTLAPPTRDHAALAYFLQGVTPTMASVYDPGTLVSIGVREAAALLASEGGQGVKRAIVLITDGEAGEREQAATASARRAAADGIEIHVIGVGTYRGTGMVLPDGSYRKGGPVVDATGVPVTSRLREPRLQRLAQAAGGVYTHASDEGGVRAVQRALTASTSEPSAEAVPPAWSRFDLTFWFALGALICLLSESLLDVRGPRVLIAARRAA